MKILGEDKFVRVQDLIEALDKIHLASNVREDANNPHSPIMVKYQDIRRAISELDVMTDYTPIPEEFCNLCNSDKCEECFMCEDGLPREFRSMYESQEMQECDTI